MKKIILLVFLVGLFSISAFSQRAATVISENANLRGTPSANGKVVEVLPLDSQIKVITQKGVWFLIQSDDYVGWMHGNTIRLLGNDSVTETYKTFNPTPGKSPILKDVKVSVENNKSDEDENNSSDELVVRIPQIVSEDTSESSTTTRSTSSRSTSSTVPESSVNTSRTYITGERGGCYYINSNGNKSYVERDLCSADTPTTITPSSTPGSGTVQVRGYFRKDGTYVRPHTRKAPSHRRKN